MDEELLSEFLVESNENMASIEQQLTDLEANPKDSALLDAIFRTVHTVKGSCGFIGLTSLQEIAHSGENVLGKMRSTGYAATPDLISMLLECADAIQTILDALEARGREPEVDHASLIRRLHAVERIIEAGGTFGVDDPKDVESGGPDANQHEGAPDAAPIAWLEGFENECRQRLAAAGLNTPESLLKTGFAGLKKINMPPALALQLLGTAKSAVKIKIPETITAEVQPASIRKEGRSRIKSIGETAGGVHVQETIRVELSVLDSLMNQVGELVLTRNRLMQVVNSIDAMAFADHGTHPPPAGHANAGHLIPISRDIDHITEHLQEQLLKTRMQPISSIWGTVPRVVRDMGRQLNKKIKVVMEGQDTELDRTILAALKDPLTHIIRNSCDHGIETPSDRLAAGKSDTGTLTLTARQESGSIMIQIIDDGAGIDAEAVKNKAVDMGVLTDDTARGISDSEALQLIFHAGLSTAKKVSNISGRGVGMDVVKTAIEKAGGSVKIQSQTGMGATLNIHIPLTMAIIPALIAGSKGQRFAIPQMSVLELLTAHQSSREWRTVAGQSFFHLRGQLLPVMRLSDCLQLGDNRNDHGTIVVIHAGNRTFGILVDKIFGAEELVVKPLGAHFREMPFFGGCSILGDGCVIPIMECNGLVRLLRLSAEAEAATGVKETKETAENRDLQYTLVFHGNGSRFALPMRLVERLEDVPSRSFETVGNHEVLQYRGEVIPVLRWNALMGQNDEFIMDDEAKQMCLILADGNKRMCLQVDTVEDILETEIDLKIKSEERLLMGTTVIQGQATAIVDVFEVLKKADPGWFSTRNNPAMDRRRRILFAEDASFFRGLLVPLLESMNFEVWQAGNGMEAEEILARKSPDLILTDLEMPDVDGYELAQWVRKQPNLNHIPIAALTANPPNERNLGSRTPFDKVLIKMDRSGLVEYLQTALDGKPDSFTFADRSGTNDMEAIGDVVHG